MVEIFVSSLSMSLSCLMLTTCSLPPTLMTACFPMVLVSHSQNQHPIISNIYTIPKQPHQCNQSATSQSFIACRKHHQPLLTGFRNSTPHIRCNLLEHLNSGPCSGSNSNMPKGTFNCRILRCQRSQTRKRPMSNLRMRPILSPSGRGWPDTLRT